jgi:hypothetical protein
MKTTGKWLLMTLGVCLIVSCTKPNMGLAYTGTGDNVKAIA